MDILNNVDFEDLINYIKTDNDTDAVFFSVRRYFDKLNCNLSVDEIRNAMKIIKELEPELIPDAELSWFIESSITNYNLFDISTTS